MLTTKIIYRIVFCSSARPRTRTGNSTYTTAGLPVQGVAVTKNTAFYHGNENNKPDILIMNDIENTNLTATGDSQSHPYSDDDGYMVPLVTKNTEVYNGDENTKPDKHTMDDTENTYLTPTCVSQSLQYSDDDGYTVCQ